MDRTPPPKHLIRRAIADDHPYFREGLKLALKKFTNIEIVAEANDGMELLEAIQTSPPDVVITDIAMPRMDGIQLTKTISEKQLGIEVIAMSMHDEEAIILDMIEAGARGYLLKNSSKEELETAITLVHNKQTYYCNLTANKIVRLVSRTHYHPYKINKNVQFSEREIEIIRMICEEFCAKEIAQKLKSNSNAINTARERIRTKIGARSTTGIIIYAIRFGLYSID